MPFGFSVKDLASDYKDAISSTMNIDVAAAEQAMLDRETAALNASTRKTMKDGNSYTPIWDNWYRALPYGFRRYDRQGYTRTCYLPISPENITIQTQFATNVVATLYGTVEQHSEMRYFDVTIEGTTGMAPTYINDKKKEGRLAVSAGDNWGKASAGGFFASTIGRYNALAGKAQDLINPVENTTGVTVGSTGYRAFHELYLFFLDYKKDAAGINSDKKRRQHPLNFLNYKDNNQYNVAITGFTCVKSINDPMLYRYKITMRGYNLRPLDAPDMADNYKQRIADLGLDGVKGSSLLGDIKKTVGGAKGLLGGALGALGGLGG